MALSGYADARGFRQWKQVERTVKKSERGFPILVPLRKRVTVEEDNGETAQRSVLYGFKHTIVFGLEQTEGKPLPPADPRIHEWIESLPLLDVARHWGITVEVYSGRSTGPLGKFRFDGHIALGVENLATWSHEMVHAADHRLGHVKERGQHWRSEIVA
ncbi:ArdC family protein [Thalassoroseus pseudoceratinae]|uniref:ArdC family protein n=1 Tax=Thalassoroseus pseudoceratinae TaxID=2713176 RepID=UPI001422FE19|nr:ArdC family protein [Thalassoroseus pseudoceratinae]